LAVTKWTFWEWVAYAALFVAAMIIAADQAIKMEPDLRQRLEIVVANPIWAFAPIALILLATGIFIGRNWERKTTRQGRPINAGIFNPVTQPIREEPVSEKPARKEAVADQEERRVFVNVPPDYLMKFFEDHTQILATRLVEPYVGKWIKISAPVFNVSARKNSAGEQTMTVALHRPKSTILFMLAFGSQWADVLTILRKDDLFTAIGKIEAVDRTSITLVDCEPAQN